MGEREGRSSSHMACRVQGVGLSRHLVAPERPIHSRHWAPYVPQTSHGPTSQYAADLRRYLRGSHACPEFAAQHAVRPSAGTTVGRAYRSRARNAARFKGMEAAFLSPRDAVAAGVPKSTAHRIKDHLSSAVAGQLLVIDGAVVTSPEGVIAVLHELAERAEAAEAALQEARLRTDRLDQDLQLTRHELDVQRARAATMGPRLAAVAAQVAQLLDENLNAPESKLTG